jgi:hypothetical protein
MMVAPRALSRRPIVRRAVHAQRIFNFFPRSPGGRTSDAVRTGRNNRYSADCDRGTARAAPIETAETWVVAGRGADLDETRMTGQVEVNEKRFVVVGLQQLEYAPDEMVIDIFLLMDRCARVRAHTHTRT